MYVQTMLHGSVKHVVAKRNILTCWEPNPGRPEYSLVTTLTSVLSAF